jgi:hypothetical protein
VRNRVAIIAGAAAAAAGVAYGLLRRRTAPTPLPSEHAEPAEPDPRAEALREKLAASREIVTEREAFEEAETPVDEAVAAESDEDVEERRRSVHERGRAAAEQMRDEPS